MNKIMKNAKSLSRSERRRVSRERSREQRAVRKPQLTPLAKFVLGSRQARPDQPLFVLVDLKTGVPMLNKDAAPVGSSASDPLLDALDPTFKNHLKWNAPFDRGGAPRMTTDTCVVQTRPTPEYNHDGHRAIVAFHRDHYPGDVDKTRDGLAQFWEDQTNVRPPTVEFIKSALPIWKSASLGTPDEAITHTMHLDDPPQATIQALHAALFSTFITSIEPVDLDAVVYALTVFVHSDPRFSDCVSRDKVPAPYGEDTVYAFAKIVE